MIYLIELYDRLLSKCTEGTEDDLKRVTELSMCLHYVEKLTQNKDISVFHASRIKDSVNEYIHSKKHLMLLDNYFLLQQHITPYIFIRSDTIRSKYFEKLIEVFKENDFSSKECLPYRTLERNFLLYKANLKKNVTSFKETIISEASQLQYFSRDLSYAFTHTLFYSTDFSCIKCPNNEVKDYCKLLVAKSYYENDVDLFFEACICLMSQNLDEEEIRDMITLISDIQQKNNDLFECSDIIKDYHPILVYEILRANIKNKLSIDLEPRTAQEGSAGPITSLQKVLVAMQGKDINKIIENYRVYCQEWGEMIVLKGIVNKKIEILKILTNKQVLFEKEFMHLGTYDLSMYQKYKDKLESCTKNLSI